MAADLYIGLMSGTSADAVDAALVDFSNNSPHLIAAVNLPLPTELQTQLHQLAEPANDELSQLASLDRQLGQTFAKAAKQVIAKAGIKPADVKAIGSHGQTIRHIPGLYSLQIADPNIIAAETGITTVADFRRRDIALGGQGAPLAPAYHAAFYRDSHKNRIILNIGGIANITYLPAQQDKVIGFDTGPGNTLLDAWCQRHTQQTYDQGGKWASQGQVIASLLNKLLQDPYFSLSYPKSTGKEYFNLTWLQQHLMNNANAIDVQATLVELTAVSISTGIKSLTSTAEVLVCGGGAYNTYLMQRLADILGKEYSCRPIDLLGVPAEWVEAVAFAWLARQCLQQQPIDLTDITGSRSAAVLGGVYWA